MTHTIEAYRLVLKAVLDGHPDRALAHAQIDGLVAQLMLKPDGSIDMERPLAQIVQSIKESLRPDGV